MAYQAEKETLKMDKTVFDYYVRKIKRLLIRAKDCDSSEERKSILNAARTAISSLKHEYFRKSSDKNSFKPLDKGFEKMYNDVNEFSTDGGSGSGNYNHEGVPGHRGGSKRKLSKAEMSKIRKRFIGSKTSDGVEITNIWNHAFDRIGERKISSGRIQKMLESSKVSPDKTHSNRRVYDIPGSRLVVDVEKGEIVTVEWRKSNK